MDSLGWAMSNDEGNEALLLSLIEGDVLSASERARAEALLEADPTLRRLVEEMKRDREAVVASVIDVPEIDLSRVVLSRFDEELAARVGSMPSMRIDDHARHATGEGMRRLALRYARPMAAAAALAVIAGVVFVAVQRAHNRQTQPLLPPIVSDDAPRGSDPEREQPMDGERVVQGADELEALGVELASAEWESGPEVAVPSIAEAALLLAEGRLVIRALAVTSEGTAPSAMITSLKSSGDAWAIASEAFDADLAAGFERGGSEAVFAFDGASGQRIEIPRPSVVEARAARVDVDATAVASLIAGLRELGWRVRLEESAVPMPLPPMLVDAVWFEGAPSTWRVVGQVPIVIEQVGRGE